MTVFRGDEPRGLGPLIPCACECGQMITMYDERKRPRQYVRGHHVKAAWQRMKREVLRKA